MQNRSHVVIVGAGPYGLSIAAHLKAAGVRLRVFGRPMSTWREQMPQGMFLKSDGFASSLSDPLSTFTLKHYCEREGVAYDDTRVPVRLETFLAYGVAFQQLFVPQLEDKQVTGIERDSSGFVVTLDDGKVVLSDKVVIAVGITHFAHLPPEFDGIPQELATHSSAVRHLEDLRGHEIAILGAGASGLDLAALLHEAGAKVTLIARGSAVHFHTPPGTKPRPWWQRLRHPQTGIGPGLRSRFYTSAPGLFRLLPRNLRHKIVRTHLRPAAGWPMKDRVLGKVPLLLGYSLAGAAAQGDRIELTLRAGDGSIKQHTAEHVIAATGYKARLDRLKFLSPKLRSEIEAEGDTPVLGPDFQSSMPGLYFVGAAAANTFGPMLRFAYGSDFTARRLTERIFAQSKAQADGELESRKLRYEAPAR